EAGDEDADVLLEEHFHLRTDAVREGGEEVHGEGLVGEVAGLLDLLTQLVGAEGGGAHDAEPAGVGDGGDEAGERDAAHAGEKDGVLDAEAVADGGVEGVVHGFSPIELFGDFRWFRCWWGAWGETTFKSGLGLRG